MKEKFILEEDLAGSRETPVNWEQQVRNIVDSYESERGLIHGVQKDAIQNGWDAKRHSKGAGWSFEFELHEKDDGICLLTMTDQGTFGLTGDVLSLEDLEKDLPTDQRWGRFESLAFQKEDPDSIGARGQGKFVFVGASKEKVICYDSLREDGTYRMGFRAVIGKTSSPVNSWDEEEGKAKLKEKLPLLEPLEDVGTRVIIVDPIDDLIGAIKSGEFLEMIEETWWEIICKYGVEIRLVINGKMQVASVPEYVDDLPKEDNEEYKVWYRENDKVEVSGQKMRIKRLHLVHKTGNNVPEEVRGIAIQRGGMKVCVEQAPRELPKQMADDVFGYIEFDGELNKLMRIAENVTHYGFDWRRRGAAQVRSYIGDQVIEFAHEKLGFAQDPESRRQKMHNQAESKAILAANKVAKLLDIEGVGKGKKGKRKNGGTPPSPILVRLEMPILDLPGEDLRVEFGADIGNIGVEAINESEDDLSVQLSMWMFTEDGTVVYEFIPKTDFELNAGDKKGKFGPFVITMDEGPFPTPGLYKIRAKLVVLSSPNSELAKGTILDECTRTFYLAVDPPQRIAGLFERVEPIDASNDNPMLLGWHIIGERGGYIYKYNVKHPAFEALGGDSEAVGEYLFRLLGQAILEIDLSTDDPKLFSIDERSASSSIAKKIRYLMGEWLHQYYQ